MKYLLQIYEKVLDGFLLKHEISIADKQFTITTEISFNGISLKILKISFFAGK